MEPTTNKRVHSQHHRSRCPLTWQLNSLLHNALAQALFSRCSSYFTPMCYGPTPHAGSKVFLLEAGLACSHYPWRPLIPDGYHDWVVNMRNGKWSVKTHGKHAQCLHPGCANQTFLLVFVPCLWTDFSKLGT